MSASYALAEGSERGFKQLAGQKKSGAAMAYGDLICWVKANDQWEPAVTASVKPFGFCGNNEILTQTTNNITGVVTTTKGAAASDTHTPVIVAGFIRRVAEGAIPAGEFVMPAAANQATDVQAWNGTTGSNVIGRYVRNITQHDNIACPAAADNDIIIIEVIEQLPETGTGA
jgi:hypothetical protein